MTQLILSDYEIESATVRLYKSGIFGIEEDPKNFRNLKHERKSPHYFDIRKGVSSFETRQLIGGMVNKLVQRRATSVSGQGKHYDHFVGVPEAMTTYVVTAADNERKSQLQIRANKQKTSGNKTPIMGEYKTGDRIALFEDAITSGKSTIDEIDNVQAEGLIVEDVFVMVDRQEGGSETIRQQTGVNVIAGLAVAQMVDLLRAEELISETQRDNVAEYLGQYGEPRAKAVFGVNT